MQLAEQKRLFGDWLEGHKGILFKVTRAYAFNPNDQDDLFQEICVRLWKSIPDYRGEAKVSTWIYSVSLYTAIAWARKERRHDDKTSPLATVEHTLSASDQIVDDRLEWLYTQIGKFSELDRSLCLLMLDGYSYAEMAEMMGMTVNNVGVKIHRLKQHLVKQAETDRQLAARTLAGSE